MKFRIESLSRREIRTQRGQTQVYDVTLSDGTTYDAFVASWNSDWQQGQTVELDSEQIRQRDKNGPIYWTIHPPKNGAGSAPPAEPAQSAQTFRLDVNGLLGGILDGGHDLEILIRVRKVPKPQ